MPDFKYSQSYLNDASENDVCPKELKYKYIDGVETDNEDEQNVMFRGRYFEWHLLGATRDGIQPIFIRNRGGTMKQAEADLIEVIDKARTLLLKMGLDPAKGEKQAYIEEGELSGNIDWITTDIQEPEREAIYDVKYTETKLDDRFNGWGDFDSKDASKIQATQYIILYWLKTGKYVPFYFLIFGKTGWVRIIKVELTQDGVDFHSALVERVKAKTAEFESAGWPARPKYAKCNSCNYNSFCKFKATIPEIEVHQI